MGARRAPIVAELAEVIEEELGRPREQQTRREQMEVAEILGSSFPGWAQSPG